MGRRRPRVSLALAGGPVPPSQPTTCPALPATCSRTRPSGRGEYNIQQQQRGCGQSWIWGAGPGKVPGRLRDSFFRDASSTFGCIHLEKLPEIELTQSLREEGPLSDFVAGSCICIRVEACLQLLEPPKGDAPQTRGTARTPEFQAAKQVLTLVSTSDESGGILPKKYSITPLKTRITPDL